MLGEGWALAPETIGEICRSLSRSRSLSLSLSLSSLSRSRCSLSLSLSRSLWCEWELWLLKLAVGIFAVTDESDESEEDVVVVFEPDTDLLPDLLVDTENKM